MVRPVTDEDTGLKVLREPATSSGDEEEDGTKIIDIVAVHGLGAHPDDTWTKKYINGPETHWVNWLQEKEMLPAVVPNARIMRYGYKSSWFGPDAIKQSARIVATRLLTALRRGRKSCVDRPLIFIAHSFGGLVVLKAVCDAYHDSEEWPGIRDAVRGLIFFGTPFRGADGMSQSEMVQAAAREYAGEDIEPEPLHILDPGNELLQDLVDDFLKRVWGKMPQTRIACFYELQASEIGAIVGKQRRKAFAVNERSGCLDPSDRVKKYPLERTHFNMNKFGRPTEDDYQSVAEVVEDMARGAYQPLSAQAPPVISVPIETTYEQATRRRVKYFRGRQEQLKRIQKYFGEDKAEEPRVLILQAMGGQGKSQIALEYCRQSRSIYSNVFWVNASSEMMAVQSMERVAAEIGQKLTGNDDSRSKVRLVVHTLAQRCERWLMVLDNYDDPGNFSRVDQFIPSHGHGDILLTSRSKGLEGLGQVLIVPPMTDDEGTELLLHEHPPPEVDAHQEQCRKIIQRLGGLPLAIDHAAAFIRYMQLPLDQLDEFLRLYEAQRDQVLQHTSRHFWKYGTVQIDGKEEENRAISAFTTWEMSYQQLEGDEARRGDIEHFLTVSAFFQPNHISETLFRHHWESTQPTPAWMRIFTHQPSGRDECSQLAGPEQVCDSVPEGTQMGRSQWVPDPEDSEIPTPRQGSWKAKLFWDLISKAHDLSLLDNIAGAVSVSGASFSLHPVIRDWLQVRVKSGSVPRFVSEAIEIVVDSIRQKDGSLHNSLQEGMILLGHVDMCLENDRRFSLKGQQLGQGLMSCGAAEWFAWFYQGHGRYGAAERLYRQSFDTRRQTVGVEDSSTLRGMNDLAEALRDQGKYEEAEKMHREALQLNEKVLGKVHPETLTSMGNLALALSNQGKYEEAEKMHREALQLREKVLGKEHPETLTSMNDLAGALSHQGKYEEAEKMYQEALQLREKALGKEHPSTLTSMNNLALALSHQGKYERAEKMHREALQLKEKVLGKEHPWTLTSMNNLALALSHQGKYEEAEKMHREALQLREKVLGKEHPWTLTSMNNLAGALSHQGKYEEAEKMHREALQLREKVLGKEHPETLTSMNNLALALSHQGKYEEAEKMHQEALQLKEKVLGKEHPSTLTSMDNLAGALSDQGKYEEAEKMHREALQLRETVLGKEHPETLTSMHNLAYLLASRSRFVQAAIFYERAVGGFERVLGASHPTTIACARQYSRLLNRGFVRETPERRRN